MSRRRGRTSPPATTTTSSRRPRLVPALRQRGQAQPAVRQAPRPPGADATWRTEHPEVVDRLWRVLEDEAGGTLPQFAPIGAQGGDRRVTFSRRGLLRRGGAAPPGAGPLRVGAAPPAAAGAAGRRPGYLNVVLVVLPLVRAGPRGRLRGRLAGRHAQPGRPDGRLAALRPHRPRVDARACPCGVR